MITVNLENDDQNDLLVSVTDLKQGGVTRSPQPGAYQPSRVPGCRDSGGRSRLGQD